MENTEQTEIKTLKYELENLNKRIDNLIYILKKYFPTITKEITYI